MPPELASQVLWVGLVPASLVLGPVWRSLNPLRALSAGLARLGGDPGYELARDYPARLGTGRPPQASWRFCAHDRAVGLFVARDKTRSQYSFLAVMVLYTIGGIALLVGT